VKKKTYLFLFLNPPRFKIEKITEAGREKLRVMLTSRGAARDDGSEIEPFLEGRPSAGHAGLLQFSSDVVLMSTTGTLILRK